VDDRAAVVFSIPDRVRVGFGFRGGIFVQLPAEKENRMAGCRVYGARSGGTPGRHLAIVLYRNRQEHPLIDLAPFRNTAFISTS